MWVKPAADLRVRDPRTKRHLDPEAATLVDDNDFTFAQLLAHGDVIACHEDGRPLVTEGAAPLAPIAEAEPGAEAAAEPVTEPVAAPAADAQ